MSKKILIARVDRIGDLILTLPMEAAAKLKGPAEVTWLIEENLRFIIEALSPMPQAFFVNRARGFLDQISEATKLTKWLKTQKFDEVYGVHVPWWVALSFFLARIPVRVGVASQWFSWLFYNKPIRQKRSQAIKNEAQYNLDLLGSKQLSFARLIPDPNLVEEWKARLGEGYVIVHPGMSGSARNWPAANYRDLAEKLIKAGNRVLVTGSSGDRDFVMTTGILSVNGVEDFVSKTSGSELLSIISLARAVVAPSTGVAHLAASLGKRTVGIYSPVRVQHPKRWGPLGERVRILTPQVECPGDFKCEGTSCKFYDCMKTIDVDTVVKTVMEKSP